MLTQHVDLNTFASNITCLIQFYFPHKNVYGTTCTSCINFIIFTKKPKVVTTRQLSVSMWKKCIQIGPCYYSLECQIFVFGYQKTMYTKRICNTRNSPSNTTPPIDKEFNVNQPLRIPKSLQMNNKHSQIILKCHCHEPTFWQM